MRDSVKIGRFSSTMEADLARMRLAAEGIRATVYDTSSGNAGAYTAGSIALLVAPNDEEAAQEILDRPLLEEEGHAATYRSAQPGGSVITDETCSEPTCHRKLERGEESCPKCKGVIGGKIWRASEHYAEVAAFRRELAAMPLLAEPAKKRKKRRRVAAAS